MATRVLPSPVFISAIVPSVKGDPADELHVEVPHVEHAAARLADHREGLGQEGVDRLALGQPRLEGRRFGAARSASESARSDASSSLMRPSRGRIRLISRSFRVPKMRVRMVFSMLTRP